MKIAHMFILPVAVLSAVWAADMRRWKHPHDVNPTNTEENQEGILTWLISLIARNGIPTPTDRDIAVSLGFQLGQLIDSTRFRSEFFVWLLSDDELRQMIRANRRALHEVEWFITSLRLEDDRIPIVFTPWFLQISAPQYQWADIDTNIAEDLGLHIPRIIGREPLADSYVRNMLFVSELMAFVRSRHTYDAENRLEEIYNRLVRPFLNADEFSRRVASSLGFNYNQDSDTGDHDDYLRHFIRWLVGDCRLMNIVNSDRTATELLREAAWDVFIDQIELLEDRDSPETCLQETLDILMWTIRSYEDRVSPQQPVNEFQFSESFPNRGSFLKWLTDFLSSGREPDTDDTHRVNALGFHFQPDNGGYGSRQRHFVRWLMDNTALMEVIRGDEEGEAEEAVNDVIWDIYREQFPPNRYPGRISSVMSDVRSIPENGGRLNESPENGGYAPENSPADSGESSRPTNVRVINEGVPRNEPRSHTIQCTGCEQGCQKDGSSSRCSDSSSRATSGLHSVVSGRASSRRLSVSSRHGEENTHRRRRGLKQYYMKYDGRREN